jgi:arabinogalactan endo-1,4-beta-galactosidase
MKQDKIIGIVYAYDAGDEFDMVKDLGVRWIRLNISFPWSDKMYGTLSDEYRDQKKEFERAYKNGMIIMPATPPIGGFFFDKKLKKTYWQESFPEFVGERGSQKFYDNVRSSMKFVCEDLGDMVGDLWQCTNEIDIPTFSNDYADEIVTTIARVTAEGIIQANPKARCGINISHYWDHGLEIADRAYREGHQFSYIGVDQYFGSWQGQTVEAWTDVINQLWERYKLPVLANEWGYSSAGALASGRPDPKEIPLGWADVCYLKKWFHEVEGGHTEETQAEYFRRGHEIFANNPHSLGSFMFCWRDAHTCYHCGQTECPAECYWGIVDERCRPKKAYYAVKKAIAEYYK